MSKKRWHAYVTYRTETGQVGAEHMLEEVADLHDVIEGGPHWDCVLSIVITRHPMLPDLTIEAAEKL